MAAARQRDLVRGGDDIDELCKPEAAAHDLLVVGGDRDIVVGRPVGEPEATARDLVVGDDCDLVVGRPLGDCDLCRDGDDILREKADS